MTTGSQTHTGSLMTTAFAAPPPACRHLAAAARPPPPTCAYSRAPYTSPILPLTHALLRRPEPAFASAYARSVYAPTLKAAYASAVSGGGSPPRRRGRGGGGGGGKGDGRGGGGEAGDGDGVSAIAIALKKYNELLTEAPLRTKMATAMVLNVVADILAQGIGGCMRSDGLDMGRLARFAVFGALLAGPAGHYWFSVLDFFVRTTGVRGAFMKTTADTLMFSPVILVGFFGAMALMEGKSHGVARKEVEEKVPGTLRTSWKIWPFINMVTFGLVPAPMRVLFVNGISVFWISFLSVVNGKEETAS